MIIHLKNLFFRPSGRLDRKVDSGISQLNTVAEIEKADVVLEKRQNASPPFLATLHLAVPGPDVHVSAEGFTPESALEKALAKVTRVFRERKAKILLRQRKPSGAVRTLGRSSGRLAFC